MPKAERTYYLPVIPNHEKRFNEGRRELARLNRRQRHLDLGLGTALYENLTGERPVFKRPKSILLIQKEQELERLRSLLEAVS